MPPETALFGIGLDKWTSKFHVFITHVLIAARRALASAWRADTSLSSIKSINFLNTRATLRQMFARLQGKKHYSNKNGHAGLWSTETVIL